MSLIRQLIKTPPVVNEVTLAQALTDLAKHSRNLGEPVGVFISHIRSEICRPLHKCGWENPALKRIENNAKGIYLSLPARPEQEARWKQMVETRQEQTQIALEHRRAIAYHF
jgi:hypothetical protein